MLHCNTSDYFSDFYSSIRFTEPRKMANQNNQDADSRAFITSITLGGFQVFDKPTTIPLGRLTFLFGPNSAGKSTVEDGLITLQEALIGSKVPDKTGLGSVSALARSSWRDDLEARHWRRIDSTPDGFAPILTMGLTASLRLGLALNLSLDMALILSLDMAGSYDDSWEEGLYGHEINVTFRLSRDDNERDRYTLAVDGQGIIQIENGLGIGVNFAHPVLRGFKPLHNFAELAVKSPECINYEDGWAWLWSSTALLFWLERSGFDRSIIINGLGKPFEGKISQQEDLPEEIQMALPAANEILDFFNNINNLAVGSIHITPHLVAASRRIPTQNDLTYLCTGHGYDDEHIESFNLEADSDPIYRDLAESCLYASIGNRLQRARPPRELLDRVNRALSDHLFLERGYAVAGDIRLLIDFNEFRYLDPSMVEALPFPALVQLHLVDSMGRRYSFEDVGSGLGYVLPVLCSIFRNESDAISLLQQPELHLHPALQSALADVFIESASTEHQIIIETHSEHLLLRVLKRIRQTTMSKVQTPELSLKPEDVAVVYFDPSPEGVTTVKHLRISEDGEFLDRWPRGFFTERDGELFDE